MLGFCVFTRTAVPDQELRHFVEELGGARQGGGVDERAVFSQGKAYAILDRESIELLEQDFTEAELDSLRHSLGCEIRSLFAIHYKGLSWGRSVGRALAEHVALGMIERWGGTVDRDGG